MFVFQKKIKKKRKEEKWCPCGLKSPGSAHNYVWWHTLIILNKDTEGGKYPLEGGRETVREDIYKTNYISSLLLLHLLKYKLF